MVVLETVLEMLPNFALHPANKRKTARMPSSLEKPAVSATNSVSTSQNGSGQGQRSMQKSSFKPYEKARDNFVKPIATPTQHGQRKDDLTTPAHTSAAAPARGSDLPRKPNQCHAGKGRIPRILCRIPIRATMSPRNKLIGPTHDSQS